MLCAELGEHHQLNCYVMAMMGSDHCMPADLASSSSSTIHLSPPTITMQRSTPTMTLSTLSPSLLLLLLLPLPSQSYAFFVRPVLSVFSFASPRFGPHGSQPRMQQKATSRRTTAFQGESGTIHINVRDVIVFCPLPPPFDASSSTSAPQ